MKLEPLEPGDVKCDQCDGTGKPGNNLVTNSIVPWYCNKCNGTGKLDWIENIRGVKKRELFTATWKIDTSKQAQYLNDFQDEYIKELSKAMAVNIDKQILESIEGECNGFKTR